MRLMMTDEFKCNYWNSESEASNSILAALKELEKLQAARELLMAGDSVNFDEPSDLYCDVTTEPGEALSQGFEAGLECALDWAKKLFNIKRRPDHASGGKTGATDAP